MQDRFKVGDKLIFRKGMHKVADMLNTSFYDVLTSVYEITGTEGRCYLMKSEKGRGRVWKIRKSRIDRLATRIVFYNGVARIGDDKAWRREFHFVPKSAVKQERQRSHDLFEGALSLDDAFIDMIGEFERKYVEDVF